MIPKIIHFVWLGNSSMPQKMQECCDSWRRAMPEFEIVVWDDVRIKEIDNVFMMEAYKEKKWAFVSDVVRLYAILNYGGIYLDTDVYAYKSFEPLLNTPAFIGRENSMHIAGNKTINYLTTCCFGAERNNRFIRRCYEYYRNRHFITSDDASLPMSLRLDVRLNSEIFTILAAEIGYQASVLKNFEQHCEDVLTVYPSSYFDPVGKKPESYCVHLALGTWRERPIQTWKYSLTDKIAWRLWAVMERVVRRFNRTILKLN